MRVGAATCRHTISSLVISHSQWWLSCTVYANASSLSSASEVASGVCEPHGAAPCRTHHAHTRKYGASRGGGGSSRAALAPFICVSGPESRATSVAMPSSCSRLSNVGTTDVSSAVVGGSGGKAAAASSAPSAASARARAAAAAAGAHTAYTSSSAAMRTESVWPSMSHWCSQSSWCVSIHVCGTGCAQRAVSVRRQAMVACLYRMLAAMTRSSRGMAWATRHVSRLSTSRVMVLKSCR